jgi:hypothetical protein
MREERFSVPFIGGGSGVGGGGDERARDAAAERPNALAGTDVAVPARVRDVQSSYLNFGPLPRPLPRAW